jgi:uncharacterized membrane protein (DUF485 family)
MEATVTRAMDATEKLSKSLSRLAVAGAIIMIAAYAAALVLGPREAAAVFARLGWKAQWASIAATAMAVVLTNIHIRWYCRRTDRQHREIREKQEALDAFLRELAGEAHIERAEIGGDGTNRAT